MLNWAGASRFANLQNAARLMAAGFKDKRALTAAGAFFRGAELPTIAANSPITPAFWSNLQGASGNWGTGLFRTGMVAGAGIAAWSMLPRNNTLAAVAGAAAGVAAFGGLGRFDALTQGMRGMGLRAGGGLLAGSMTWQGLRAPTPEDYRPT